MIRTQQLIAVCMATAATGVAAGLRIARFVAPANAGTEPATEHRADDWVVGFLQLEEA